MRKRYASLFLLALLAPASAMASFTLTGYGYSQQAAYQNLLAQVTQHCRGTGYLTQLHYTTVAGGVYATGTGHCALGLSPITGW